MNDEKQVQICTEHLQEIQNEFGKDVMTKAFRILRGEMMEGTFE